MRLAVLEIPLFGTAEIGGAHCSSFKLFSQSAALSCCPKEHLLQHQQAELQKTRQEIERVYRLYQDGQLDSTGFGKFYKPLEERSKKLEADIPRLEAEIDLF